jgi:NtrC-family two-component system response regulator AlgB
MRNLPESTQLNILVVDDEVNIRKMLVTCLETTGHHVTAVSNGADALSESVRRSFDLAFVDLRLGAERGSDLIPGLLGQSPWMRVVVITAHGSIDSAVETMKQGATDYLTKPFTPTQVRLVTERVRQFRALEQRVAELQGLVGESNPEVSMESSSPPMQRAVSMAHQIAKSDATCLLRGESGTGKGVLAKAIHLWSPRSAKPFSTVSCPSLSSQLLESELFGHARGAFTGAVRENSGRIAMSEGGTLFLDEIGDLPLDLQPKLLRFVQDREYERVGEAITRRADVRLIAATNANLESLVARGRFREDLLYRVNVVQIELPPLRDRREDVLPLADELLAWLNRGKHTAVGFTDDARQAMQSYPWPGNVRELRNVVERATILCQSDRIGLEHLPAGFGITAASPQLGDPISLDRIEEMHIRRILASNPSLEEAARILDIDLATLWRRRKKYGI